MASDNKADSYPEDPVRKGRIQNILDSISQTPFGQGFGQAFNLDAEDRRDVLYSRREAEGKQAIPTRAVQTLSQNPLVDSIRQYATVAKNPVIPQLLTPLGLGPFNDGMYSYRGNSGMNIGGAPSEENRLPDLEFDETTGTVRKPTAKEARSIAADKARIRELPLGMKIGYGAGGLANDFVNNLSRNIYWTINAMQAPVDLASEAVVAKANPDLYSEEAVDLQKAIDDGLVRYSPDYDEAAISRVVAKRQANRMDPLPNLTGEAADFGGYTRAGEEADLNAAKEAVRKELYSRDNPKNYKRAAPGVRVRFDKGTNKYEVRRRAYSPTLVNVASMLPAAAAVNIGLGLMGSESNGTITGRQAGYTAALPDELDPRTTSNAIGEIAMRYFVGREGRLMNPSDFLLERPDVTAAEYAKYRGYLSDRETDLILFDDGKFNIAGILKGTSDGIRGPEISFLGKSAGLNDTGVPVGSAILGSTLGALAGRNPRIRGNKPLVMGSLIGGGLTGLVGGQVLGSTLEEARRQKRFEERNPGVDYKTYKANARNLLDEKYRLIKENPNAIEEKEKSSVGFNKRAKQEALQTEALKQQTLIDQLIDEERKQRALKANAERELALNRFDEIESSFER